MNLFHGMRGYLMKYVWVAISYELCAKENM